MTKEELMIPRFEVIASAPLGFDSYFKVGDVITLDGLDEREHLADTVCREYANVRSLAFYLSDFRQYPHLFRPMHWSEGRTPEQMPEYLLHIKNGCVFRADTVFTQYPKNFQGTSWSQKVEPATLSEYEAYTNTQS